MASRRTLAVGAAVLAGVAFAGRRYVRDRTTPRVDYEAVDRTDGVEIRRYPPTVVVETVAPTENRAFRRLFDYISGENSSATELSMTAPVESDAGVDRGETVSMTAPVESESADAGVRMAFFLPSEYDYDSAPRPTDDSVRLVERPGRTLAVCEFSWWATDGRVERKAEALQSALGDVEIVGDPFLMRYEGPLVPPFLRTNEVAVEIRRTSSA